MVRIRDVAEAAGVSPMTVSNVINGRSHVRAENRERVLAAIDALGYRVNVAARNLRRGRTGTIGLALPDLGNPYYAQLATRIVETASRRGLRVVVEQTGAVRRRELELVATSQARLHDGLIMSSAGLTQADAELLAVDHPVVLLGEAIFGGPIDHIAMPNTAGARAAVEHLIGRGCRRIAILDRPRQHDTEPEDLRLLGYQQALLAAGIEPSPSWFIPMPEFTMAAGAAAAIQAIEAVPDIDGIFCPMDTIAFGALRGLADRGVAVPEQVRVIGFDDLPASEFSVPRLSSVAPDHLETAETAVRFLLERLEGTASPGAREHEVGWVVQARESTQ